MREFSDKEKTDLQTNNEENIKKTLSRRKILERKNYLMSPSHLISTVKEIKQKSAKEHF